MVRVVRMVPWVLMLFDIADIEIRAFVVLNVEALFVAVMIEAPCEGIILVAAILHAKEESLHIRVEVALAVLHKESQCEAKEENRAGSARVYLRKNHE